MIAVVKADAYGHGAVPIARTLSAAGVGAFAVARVDEAIELRDGGIREPILVLSGAGPRAVPAILAHRLTPVIHDLETARAMDERLGSSRLSYHLKIDTGMARLGLRWDHAGEALGPLLRCTRLDVEGVLTHFADADSSEAFAEEQLARFRDACDALAPLTHLAIRHAANSAASIRRIATDLDCIRPGKSLYGAYPSDADRARVALRPAMRVATRVIAVKRVPEGWTVGYGRTWTARRPSVLAAVAMGFGDGLPRALSNRGSFTVHGRRVPIVGRVCMDMTTLDVTDVAGGVEPGDEAVLIGDGVSPHDVAEAAGTIFSDVLTSLSKRVARLHRSAALISDSELERVS